MSIKVQSYVWEHSRAKGSALLLLLAIADFSHDDGRGAYPSMETLSKKCRQSIRNTDYLIRKLESMGEITVESGKSTRSTNSYTIPMGTGDNANFAMQNSAKKNPQIADEPLGTIRNQTDRAAKTAAPPIEGGSVNYEEKLDRALGDKPKKEKTHPPRTPLGKYLAENVSYGNKKWEGFVSAAQRKEWERLEQERYDDLKWAIDWAIPKKMPALKLAGNIMTAAYKRKPDPKKEIPKEVTFSKDGGFYI